MNDIILFLLFVIQILLFLELIYLFLSPALLPGGGTQKDRQFNPQQSRLLRQTQPQSLFRQTRKSRNPLRSLNRIPQR